VPRLFGSGRTFRKYALLEAPGWVLAGVLASALHAWVGLSTELAVLLVVFWVLKDLALYPWLRPAYESDPRSETEKLAGSTAVAVQPLDPVGYVRLAGELWRADAGRGSASIPAGSRVRVRAAEGLTLLVTPEEPPPQDRPRPGPRVPPEPGPGRA
jgi:membrane protein implicated in regulation of membrane protease activity